MSADPMTPDELLARFEQLERSLSERIEMLEAALAGKDELIKSLALEVETARVSGALTARVIAAEQLSAATLVEGATRLEDKYAAKSAEDGVVNGNLQVRGSLVIQDGISGQLAELNTADHPAACVRAHDLLFGSATSDLKRNNAMQGRALVDNGTTLAVNAGSDWNSVTIDSAAQVNGKLTVSAGIEGRLGRLDVAETPYAYIRSHDLIMGFPGRPGKRKGAQGRALVDEGPRLVVNFAGDWPEGTRVDGNLLVAGRLSTKGGYWSKSYRCRLEVQDDGNLVLFHANGSVIWATNTGGRASTERIDTP